MLGLRYRDDLQTGQMSEVESARGLEGDCWRERLWRDLKRGDAPPSLEWPPPAGAREAAFDIVEVVVVVGKLQL